MQLKQLKKYCIETLKYALRSKLVIRPYIKEFESLHRMSDEQLRKWEEKRFIEIFRKAYTKSPFYNKFYREAGISLDDITSLDDLKKLPVLTKEMIKAHGREMLTEPAWKLVKNHTSGTTGTPLQVWESWPALWREQACFHFTRQLWGYKYCQPLVSMRGNLDKDETHLKVNANNTLYLSSFNINNNIVKLYHDLIVRHKPVAIEGYPSTLYSFALLLRDNGLSLNVPLTFTSSETLLDVQRKVIERQFNTEIFDHFGTTERSIRLYEAKDHSGYFEMPGYSINEFDENGEISTSLINDAFPLIRYRGYDLMDVITDKNNRPFIKKINGRKSCAIMGKDGSQYSSALLTRVLKDVDSIDIAQFVQSKPGEVSLNIVPGRGFDEKIMEQLKSKVAEQLGVDNFDYKFNIIETDGIIYSSRGKFSYVISNT